MNNDELAWQDVLFADFAVLVTEAVLSAGELVVRARGRADDGCCPCCGRASARVHDRYGRRLQDLPLAGRRVRIFLVVRRFICVNDACSQRTFAEQIPGLTSMYARCTDRLESLLGRSRLPWQVVPGRGWSPHSASRRGGWGC
ncbi:transposase family protein [Streptomyces phaeochromogenes]|uniref:transposase family protein n=1 Tax=Streptomyces phaeochromogenes TaxID=1923 RepID=UPI0033C0E65C